MHRNVNPQGVPGEEGETNACQSESPGGTWWCRGELMHIKVNPHGGGAPGTQGILTEKLCLSYSPPISNIIKSYYFLQLIFNSFKGPSKNVNVFTGVQNTFFRPPTSTIKKRYASKGKNCHENYIN